MPGTRGVYARAPFLKRAMSLGMTVVSRLRKDADLLTVLGTRTPGVSRTPYLYCEKSSMASPNCYNLGIEAIPPGDVRPPLDGPPGLL